MTGLVLSLFPGIGLLDMAFEEEGFCVVRGPDLLWGGDIRRFHPPAGRFDGVIGGPPCQSFSTLRNVNPAAGGKDGNQIPEFERIVCQTQPAWFLMENVERAPLPNVRGYIVHDQLIRDHWVGGETQRLRRFSFGTVKGSKLCINTLALHRLDPARAVTAAGGEVPGRLRRRRSDGRLGDRNARSTAVLIHNTAMQGLPPDFLSRSPFTVAGKIKVIGNGVPLAMGRAVARAVKAAVGEARATA